MDPVILEGIQLTPQRIIPGDLGQVMHGLKSTDAQYNGFGEAYFSTVSDKAVKGWKKHTKMVANIVVPVGAVRFVLYDDRPESSTIGKVMEVTLSSENYQRLTIPINLWLAFQGASPGLNLLLNVSSMPHDPAECLTLPIDNEQIPFKQW